MADLTFTRSGELEVTQIESETEQGTEFIDSWMSAKLFVVDSGRVILPTMLIPPMEKAAVKRGLTVEHEEGL